MSEQKHTPLLPCPFCDSHAEWINEALADGHYYIRCSGCFIFMKADRRDKVIGMWNSREQVAELTKENERLGNIVHETNRLMSDNEALTEQVQSLQILKDGLQGTINGLDFELSRLREREKELVEALREAVPIVKESISEYQRLMDVETFQEAAWAMNQVKEQTEQTLAKIESLLSKFEV